MPDEIPITFYYPGMSSFQPDGALVMRATGYDKTGHWTGQHRVRAEDPDYKFWCWLRGRYGAKSGSAPRFLSDRELSAAREEFRRDGQDDNLVPETDSD